MSYEKTLNLIFSNDLILSELKRLFDEEAKKNMPELSGQTNEVLGADYRAFCRAKEIIEDVFTHLQSLQRADGGSGSVKYK